MSEALRLDGLPRRCGRQVAIVDLDTQEEVTYGTLDDQEPAGEWMQPRDWSRATEWQCSPPIILRCSKSNLPAKVGAICIPLNWRLTVPELQYAGRLDTQSADLRCVVRRGSRTIDKPCQGLIIWRWMSRAYLHRQVLQSVSVITSPQSVPTTMWR